jgi:hypothetical protein
MMGTRGARPSALPNTWDSWDSWTRPSEEEEEEQEEELGGSHQGPNFSSQIFNVSGEMPRLRGRFCFCRARMRSASFEALAFAFEPALAEFRSELSQARERGLWETLRSS